MVKNRVSIQQLDSMLPCVCSAIDCRWRQNVVRAKTWHTKRYPSVSLMFLPHFDVFCNLLLNSIRIFFSPQRFLSRSKISPSTLIQIEFACSHASDGIRIHSRETRPTRPTHCAAIYHSSSLFVLCPKRLEFLRYKVVSSVKRSPYTWKKQCTEGILVETCFAPNVLYWEHI